MSHNVGVSQLKIIKQELKRGEKQHKTVMALGPWLLMMFPGMQMTDDIFFKYTAWEPLWEERDFFHDHGYYLQILSASTSKENAAKW